MRYGRKTKERGPHRLCGSPGPVLHILSFRGQTRNAGGGGAVAQALMLPFVSMAALYFLYYQTHERLRPEASWIFGLWISAIAMTAVGFYQVWREFGNWFG